MVIASQLAVLALLVGGFLHCLWMDFHGLKERQPGGFSGAISSIVINAISALALWKAGAFSMLF